LVWNVVRAQGVSRETALDVVQTVWLTLLLQLDRIRTPAALASWLVSVARREARRVRAAERTQISLPETASHETPAPDKDVASAVVDGEQYRCLWRNVRRLSPRCQELVRIVAFADRPDYASVAQALDMPKGSIGPTRGRCLAKLRTLLGNDPTWSTHERRDRSGSGHGVRRDR
jgi:RNA polymerase sigma factor (sigma-70 family)